MRIFYINISINSGEGKTVLACEITASSPVIADASPLVLMASHAWRSHYAQWISFWSACRWVRWLAGANISSVAWLLQRACFLKQPHNPHCTSWLFTKKWGQFSLQVFARAWPNMKNDFIYNCITSWQIFFKNNNNSNNNTPKIELPSSKAIQMDFLTSFCTNISFMFLEIAREIFISTHISVPGLRKFLFCTLKSNVCHY